MKNFNRKNSETNKQKGRKGVKGLLALALAVVMMAASVLPAFAGSIYDIFDPGSGGSIKDSTEITETVEDNGSQGGSQGSQTGGGVYDSTGGGYYESTEDYYSEDTVWNGDYYEEVEVIPSTEQGDFEEVVEVIEDPAEVVDDTAVVEEELIEDTQDTAQLPVVTLSDAREDRGKNVFSLAQAYLGWGEHYSDYKEYADGTVVGATIFGETFGDAYMPWNVSFVSYILQLAGIDDLPLAKNMSELAAALKGSDYAGRVVKADSYTPVEGDLVLLGLPGKTIAEINPATTIEKLAELDASAYSAAGAGVAAGLVNASAVASANQQDDRAEAVYTRVGIVKSIGQKQEKDAAGHTVTRNILTVIEGDVEDPAVAGVTDIEAQYRMTGSVEEVEYDLDAMTLTYDDIAGLSAEELDELKKTSPQVLDYIILTKENVAEPTPTPTPEPTPVPEKIEDVSADAIDQNSIGAGAMLGLMVKPKAELVASEAAHAALETADLTSLRLIIGAEDGSIFANDTRVVAGYNGIYLLQAETEEEARAAFLAYYDKVDFIAPDVAVAIADGETDEDPAEEVIATENVYTEEANPFVELETALEETPAAPKRNVRRIALIDTGASVSSNSNKGVIEAVSMIGENGADDNGHGERMVAFILSENPDAEILSIKALGADGKGDVSAVIAGIQYALENRASIINLSVSAYATEENAALADAIRKATEAGATVVGAAGNNGFNAKYYTPANIAEATIIGACDENGNRIAASNFGETVDYYMVAEATSEAAAKFSGFISANGEDAVADALGNGAIFAAEYEAPVETPAETTEETPEEGDGKFVAASAYGGKNDQGDAQTSVRTWLTDRENTGSGKYFLDPDDNESVVVKTWDALKGVIEQGTRTKIYLDPAYGGIAAYCTINVNREVTIIGLRETNRTDTIYTDAAAGKTTINASKPLDPEYSFGPFFNVGTSGKLTLSNVKLTGQAATTTINASLVEYPNAQEPIFKYARVNRSGQNLSFTYYNNKGEIVTEPLVKFFNGISTVKAVAPYNESGEEWFNIQKGDGQYLYSDKNTGETSWVNSGVSNTSNDPLGGLKWHIVTNADGTGYLRSANGTSITPYEIVKLGTPTYGASHDKGKANAVSLETVNSTANVIKVEPSQSGETYKSLNSDHAYFIEVNGGTLNLEGNTEICNANGGKAPVVVNAGKAYVKDNTKIHDNKVAMNQAVTDVGGQDFTWTQWKEYYANAGQATVNKELWKKMLPKLGGDNFEFENAGAITVLSEKSELYIQGGKIYSNVGDTGAIKVMGGAKVEQTAGIIGGTTDAEGNLGAQGGAVHIDGEGSEYKMIAGEMNYNHSPAQGGAVLVRRDGTFIFGDGTGEPKLLHNYALGKGGAIEVGSDNVKLNNGELAYNDSNVMGGAIYVEGDSFEDCNTLMFDSPDKAYVYHNHAEDRDYEDGGSWLQGNGGGLWFCNWGSFAYKEQNLHVFANDATFVGDDISKQSAKVTAEGMVGSFVPIPGNKWVHDRTADAMMSKTYRKQEHGPLKEDGKPDYGLLGKTFPELDATVLQEARDLGSSELKDGYFPRQTEIALKNETLAKGTTKAENLIEGLSKTTQVLIHDNTSTLGGGIGCDGVIKFDENKIHYKTIGAELNLEKIWRENGQKLSDPERELEIKVEILNKDTDEVEYEFKPDEALNGTRKNHNDANTVRWDGWKVSVDLPSYTFNIDDILKKWAADETNPLTADDLKEHPTEDQLEAAKKKARDNGFTQGTDAFNQEVARILTEETHLAVDQAQAEIKNNPGDASALDYSKPDKKTFDLAGYSGTLPFNNWKLRITEKILKDGAEEETIVFVMNMGEMDYQKKKNPINSDLPYYDKTVDSSFTMYKYTDIYELGTTMVNNRTKIKVHKVDGSVTPDEAHSEDLPGATFELYQKGADGEYALKDTKVGTDTAWLEFNDLPVGDFYLKEANPPEGYDEFTSPIYFSRNADGSISYRGATDVTLEPITVDNKTEYQLVVGGQKLYAAAGTSGAKLTTVETAHPIVLRYNGAATNELAANKDYCLLVVGAKRNVANVSNEAAVLEAQNGSAAYMWNYVDGVLCSKQDSALYLKNNAVSFDNNSLELTVKNYKTVTFRVEKKWVGGNQSGVTLNVNILRKERDASGNWVADSSFIRSVVLDQANGWKKELTGLAPGYIYYAEEVSYTDATGETTRVNGERIGDYAILYEGNTSATDMESAGSGSDTGTGTGSGTGTGTGTTVGATAEDYTLTSSNKNDVLIALEEGDSYFVLYTDGEDVKIAEFTEAEIDTLINSGSAKGISLAAALFDVENAGARNSTAFYLKQGGKYVSTSARNYYSRSTKYTLSEGKPDTNTYSRFRYSDHELRGVQSSTNDWTRGFDIGEYGELLSYYTTHGPSVYAKAVTLGEAAEEPDPGTDPGAGEEPGDDAEEIETPGEQSTTITNTFNDKTKVKVVKRWANDKQSDRPSSIHLTLFSDEDEENVFRSTGHEVELTKASGWAEKTIENLPKMTGDGRLIKYQFVEAVPNGYSVHYEESTEDGTGITVITATNTKNDITGIKVKLEKVWKDADGNVLGTGDPNVTDEKITVILYSDYKGTDGPHLNAEGGQIEIDLLKSEGWKKEVTGLPKNKENGGLVKYWVVEKNIGAKWEMTVTSKNVTVNTDSSANGKYFGYKETNGYVSRTGGYLARSKYYVKERNGSGKPEIAYCMHFNREDPAGTSTASSSSILYDRVEPTISELNAYYNGYGSRNSMPYFGTLKDKALKEKLLKIIYFGFGHDAKGLQKEFNLDDEQFIYLTQYAVWEYTDFYGPYRGKLSYYSRTNEVYDSEGYKTKASTPYGTEARDYYTSGTVSANNIKVPSDLQKAYKKLLGYVESADTDKDIADKRLFIYEPTSQNNYQCLLGVGTVETETRITVTNQLKHVDLGIYKYEEKDGKKTPIANVAFDLYEKSTASNAQMVDVGGGTEVQAIHLGQFKTGDTGYFSFEKNGKKILVPGKTYYLKETVPAGYFALKHAISFTVDDTGGNPVVNWTDLSSNTFHFKPAPATAEQLGSHSGKARENWIGVLEIKNTELYELPSTGGIGTYWSTILGTAFLALAAMFVYNMIIGRRRRRR